LLFAMLELYAFNPKSAIDIDMFMIPKSRV